MTRPRAQAAGFIAELEALGAEVIAFPAIRIEPPADPLPLREAARSVGGYDWVVFTSVNGVERFWQELEQSGRDARALEGVRVACIGPATARALEARSIRAAVVPARFIAEDLVEAMASVANLRGARVLLPRAASARAALPAGLAAHGASVRQVEAYRTVPDAQGGAWLRQQLDLDAIDVITFTASSTVESFVQAVGTRLGRAIIVAIGPITAATARQHGLRVDIVAEEHTTAGIIQRLLDYFA